MLGWFKYYGFFVSNVAAFTTSLGLPVPLPLLQVALPVAISFYTFMAMSYVIDVRGDAPRLPGWLISRSTCRSSRTLSPGRSCAPAS